MPNIEAEIGLKLDRMVEAQARFDTINAIAREQGTIFNRLVDEFRAGTKAKRKLIQEELRIAWYEYRSAMRIAVVLNSEYDKKRDELHTLLAVMGQRLGERLPDEFDIADTRKK